MGRRRSARLLLAPLLVALALSASACSSLGADIAQDAEVTGNEGRDFWKRIFSKDTYSLYKPPIHQGNSGLLDEDAVERLRPGMRRDQVSYLLGKPVLPNVFRRDRWDYVYYHIPARGEKERRDMSLFFDDQDRLVRICAEDRCRS